MATTLTVVVVTTTTPVTQTVRVVPVSSTSTPVGWVPQFRTCIIQNLGAKQVTLSNSHPVVAKVGIVLLGGTPGGTLTTHRPGVASVNGQWWYAITTTGTTTVAFMVM